MAELDDVLKVLEDQVLAENLRSALVREDVASIADVACLMSTEASAAKLAVELLGDDLEGKVSASLILLWKRCIEVGKSQNALRVPRLSKSVVASHSIPNSCL